MIHAVFLLIGFFMIVWGIVICGLLIKMSLKAGKVILLVTVPGILVVAVLAIDFACHIFHLPRFVIPHQKQVADGIHWVLRLALIPLLLIKLYNFWLKKRTKAISPPETSL